jgi:UDP-N-acetylmuramyl pentapeptide synthase
LPSCIIFPLIPIWIGLANLLLAPYLENIKLNIQKKAARYFAENFKGKVIAVAGSYGKTTTKNYIFELVRFNYKTQMIPGNINTPTGIANWVLAKLEKNTQILIVEMDTYFIGEIARSCKITPPDIAILTNTADQHLERLGTRANLKKALHEIFEYTKPDAIKITDKSSNLEYALEVAKVLNIPKDIVNDTKKKLRKPERRGNIINMHGFETIDESYNISLATAKLALENAMKLAKNKKKKLLVITGGIPELGEENKDGNINYAKTLDKSSAEVILLKSILHKDYAENLENYSLASSMNEAWETIQKKYDPKKFVILMQPELGDQYY